MCKKLEKLGQIKDKIEILNNDMINEERIRNLNVNVVYVTCMNACRQFAQNLFGNEDLQDPLSKLETFFVTNKITFVIAQSWSIFGYIFVNGGSKYELTDGKSISFGAFTDEIANHKQSNSSQGSNDESFQPKPQGKFTFKTSTTHQKELIEPMHLFLIQDYLLNTHQIQIQSKNSQEESLRETKQNDSYIGTEKDNVSLVRFLAQTQIVPIVGLIGAFAAFQGFQIISKEKPIYQFYGFDRLDLLKEIERIPNGETNFNILNFGQDFQNKLEALNLFIPGCGALGCDYIKNLALIGACKRKKGGSLSVADFDQVEFSNLVRQILFSKKVIGLNKAVCAAMSARKINSEIDIREYPFKVNFDNLAVFDSAFWKKQNTVLNGLDNIEARKFVHSNCIYHEIPFIESALKDSQGRVATLIPHKTQTYADLVGNKSDNDMPQTKPCTIRLYPYEYIHCIQRTMEIYNELFEVHFQEFLNYLATADFNRVGQLTQQELNQKLQSFEFFFQVLINKSQSSEIILNKCYEMFVSMYVKDIQDILTLHPVNQIDQETMKPFWSAPKKPPTIIDEANEYFTAFIASLASQFESLFFNSTQQSDQPLQEYNCDSLYRYERLINQTPFDFQKASEVEAELNSSLAEETLSIDQVKMKEQHLRNKNTTMKQNIQGLREQFLNIVTLTSGSNQDIQVQYTQDQTLCTLKVPFFDKNNIYNLVFLYSASNLRCLNYNIPNFSFETSNKIGAQIEGQISNSSSAVVCVALLELFHSIINDNTFDVYDKMSCQINLLRPKVSYYQESGPKKIMEADLIYPEEGFTIWDKVVIDQCLTINELEQRVQDMFDIDEKSDIKISDIRISFPLNQHIYYAPQDQDKYSSLNIPELVKEKFPHIRINEERVLLDLSLCHSSVLDFKFAYLKAEKLKQHLMNEGNLEEAVKVDIPQNESIDSSIKIASISYKWQVK